MDAEATGWEAGMPHGGTATATFLFCDMVGSIDLLTRLGDDAGDEVGGTSTRCSGGPLP